MRQEITDKIDHQKAIDFFMATLGRSEQEVIDQVLTSLAAETDEAFIAQHHPLVAHAAVT